MANITNPKIDPAAPASLIINQWPTIQSFCADIEVSYGGVYRWLVNGLIPQRYWPSVIAAGEKRKPGIKVRQADFFDKRAA